MSFMNSSLEIENFKLNHRDTGVHKIQLTRRNNLTYCGDERYIRGKSKYWSICNENVNYFSETISLINNFSLFLETGRILILYSTKHETPEHVDHSYSDFLQEFIWIRLDNNKRFYVKDFLGVKHFVECSCVWFDSRSLHGTENSIFPSLSIRIDGIFESSFREVIYKYIQTKL
ncbi:hypothetical protein [Dendronalium phyllosphericum]|nr:hypothetical protein [Dendronalium phyllosphericum]